MGYLNIGRGILDDEVIDKISMLFPPTEVGMCADIWVEESGEGLFY
jgi:hypothetical protein